MKSLSTRAQNNLKILCYTESVVFLLIICVLSVVEALNSGTIPPYIVIILVGMSVSYLYIGIALSTYKRKKVE